MKNTHTKARARAAQQDLFEEVTPPVLPTGALDEMLNALAELLLDAIRASGKEEASDSEAQ